MIVACLFSACTKEDDLDYNKNKVFKKEDLIGNWAFLGFADYAGDQLFTDFYFLLLKEDNTTELYLAIGLLMIKI